MLKACHHVRILAVLLALLALPWSLSGCASDGASQDKPVEKKTENQPQAQAQPAPQVAAMTVAKADIPLDLSYMGQTAGSREVEVRARVGGILLRRAYVEGGPVRQGDLMFEIDPAPYEAALAQAKGALGQAEAKYDQAKRDHGRMEKLFKDNVVARKDLDDAATTLESAKAAVDEAKGALRNAELNLQWTKVSAPISGQTSRETRSARAASWWRAPRAACSPPCARSIPSTSTSPCPGPSCRICAGFAPRARWPWRATASTWSG